jgi:hypothetical protein
MQNETQSDNAAPGTPPGPNLPPAGVMRIFGPMVAGLAIDGLDLMTFGPIGLYTGLIVGGMAGYYLAPSLGFPRKGRWLAALMTGIYCTIPVTGFLPVAAIAAGLSRVYIERSERGKNADPDLRPEGAIDVEFESKVIDSKKKDPDPGSDSDPGSDPDSDSHP